MRYESFSVHIEPAPGLSFSVSVQSPQGEGQGTFQIPRIDEPPWVGAKLGVDRAGEIRDLVTPHSTPKTPVIDAKSVIVDGMSPVKAPPEMK